MRSRESRPTFTWGPLCDADGAGSRCRLHGYTFRHEWRRDRYSAAFQSGWEGARGAGNSASAGADTARDGKKPI